MTSRQTTLIFISLFVTGCAATDPGTGSTRGEVISVEYGTVMQIEQVQMDPKYWRPPVAAPAPLRQARRSRGP